MTTQSASTDALDRLREGIAALTTSEQWLCWLTAHRRFHKYSFGNTLLISLQRPDATHVAGFHTWLQLGRHVRKGEKGIVIIAPVAPRIRIEDESGDEHTIAGPARAFRTAHVFDIAQTDGNDLPVAPVERLAGDAPDNLYTQLRAVAASLAYSVEEDYLDGGRNGDCNSTHRRIRIEVRNAPAQQVKTLAHELAHAILHGDGFAGTREIAELEAESVAFLVCDGLDINSSTYTFGYVATWAGGGKKAVEAITASGQRIVRAARQIADGCVAVEEQAA
jgi:antirestriction protein ArdC